MTERNLPRKIQFVPELFDHIENMRKDEKIQCLREFFNNGGPQSKVLFEVVRFTYDPALMLEFPSGEPNLRPLSIVDYTKAPMSLFSIFKRRVPYFCKRFPQFIQDDIKRERLLIQSLEGLYEPDRKLFIQIKDKKITGWKSINESLFRDAFPAWFTWESKEEKSDNTSTAQDEDTSAQADVPSTEKKEAEESPKPKKRRGRPPKKTSTTSSNQPKKRGPGRPPKKKEESSSGDSEE